MQITVNQHYVPRFYMKHFANVKNEGTKKEKVLISFYQFKDNMLKKNIPTSSICSEDYFYDQDGKIENALADMETRWSKALKNAIDENFALDDIESIREFVIYQISRTKAMLSHNREMVTTMMKGVLKQQFGDVADEDVVKELLENKIQNEITPEFGLSIVKETIPTIRDLEMKIITNESEVGFITSDVPVIIINPLGIYSAGLGSVGEVIFFPISPWKMIFFYDAKLFGKLPDRIYDESIIGIFNQYQYVSADERLLAKKIEDINHIVKNEELNSKREQFQKTQKTNTISDGVGTLFAAKSRSIPYYYTVPILRLPKPLRKIPADFRETFPREYSYDTRLAILCRVYRGPDFIYEKELKEHWEKQQRYSKILLNYLDGYWNTPKEDRIITPELMKKLKTVPINTFMNKQR
ncbi:MAG: DUF4238 domain-containing protein [Candidatus Ornithomonoglobus sp.]